jgi:hypothetical protein
MSASPAYYRDSTVTSVSARSAFLRHLNTNTLALFLFVAFVVLNTTRSKDVETTASALSIPTKDEVLIGKQDKFTGALGSGTLDYPTKSAQGYLKVYSATDEFNDGGLAYHSHSSYAIYTTDGKLFESVENHISRNDESPELVALPVGSYLVIARSEGHGDVGIRVAIKPGWLTVLDLDLGERET